MLKEDDYGVMITQNWLSQFAYHIKLAWWICAVAGIIAIMISMLTISVQAVKSAFENPVKNLRSE
jgi:putative ABC transport system permease protein